MSRAGVRGIALAAALFAAGPAQGATLMLDIQDDPGEGFNDTSPFTPIGGNDATTLGQARQNVLNRAGEILGARLQSNVVIVVQATFDPAQCSPTSGNLGSAGAAALFRDFPGAPRPGVIYPSALANALRGSDNDATMPDIVANFNSEVDSNPNCLGGNGFYYGFDHNSQGFTDDLINTVLHELIHGLGFASGVDEPTGQNLNGSFFNIFDLFVFDEQLGAFWNDMSDAQRQSSATNGTGLVWNGAAVNGVISALSDGISAGQHVRLYAPDPVEPGSSVSHWTTDATPNLMMEPFSTSDIRGTEGVDFSICQLQDLGWPLMPGTRCPDVQTLNSAPVADAQSLQTNEDAALALTLTGSDPNNDPLTFTVLSNPSAGSLSGTPPDLTYTPNANVSGDDSFTFRVTDDRMADSTPATISITVNPVNDAPVADLQSVTVAEDQTGSITLSGSDADGNPITFSLVSQPMHGTLSGTAPNLSYAPMANFNGSDSFTFRVNDGMADSNVATVSITVTPVNDAPVANPQNVQTTAGAAVAITLSGMDAEGDTLSFMIVNAPANGTLSGTAPNLGYTPNAGFTGSDSFTFRAHDGMADSATATVSITVSQPASGGGGGAFAPAVWFAFLPALLWARQRRGRGFRR